MQRTDAVNPPEVRVAHVQATEPIAKAERAAHVGRQASLRRTLVVGFLILVLSLPMLAVAYNAVEAGKVYKGVNVLGRDLGGMSKAEARATLVQAASGYPGGTVKVSGAGKSWNLQPAALGLAIDVDKTLDTALLYGRNSGLLNNLQQQMGALFGGSGVTPVLKNDPAMIDKAVAQIALEVDKPAADSKLEIGDGGSVLIIASAVGQSLDTAALKSALTTAVSS
ncbi:MAG: peptidoglycan binding domain-containing protein, partial [Chloroflexota bacterium]|nr:peptidoglycan binding domain-containing protein [Chloroflexota bacterium]